MSAVIAAAAIDGMTDCAAAFMPSTPQWIACEGLGRTWDLPGIGGASRYGQLGHDFDLHVAVLQLPLVVLLEQYRANQPNDRGFVGDSVYRAGCRAKQANAS